MIDLTTALSLLEFTITDNYENLSEETTEQLPETINIYYFPPFQNKVEEDRALEKRFQRCYGSQYRVQVSYTVDVVFMIPLARRTEYKLIHFCIGEHTAWDVIPTEHLEEILSREEDIFQISTENRAYIN